MKLILIFFCLILFAQIICAQQNSKISQEISLDKDYLLSIGGDYSAAYGVGYGGTFKLDWIQSSKLGLGIQTIAGATAKFIDNSTNSTFISHPSLNLISDLTLTYYFLGDYNNRKTGLYAPTTHIYKRRFKMYFDIGIGYQCYKLKSSTLYNAHSDSNVDDILTTTGLGAHFSLGATQKVGEGKIFVELVAAGVFYGVDKHDVVYEASNTEIEIYNFQRTGISKDQNNFDFLGINLGYCYYF